MLYLPIMENFVQMREVLAPSGVYLLLYQGEVVYVGKSLRIFGRLESHHLNLRRVLAGKPPYHSQHGPVIMFDDVWIRFLPVDRIDAEEIRLIRHYQPKHNNHFRRVKFEIKHLPAIRELFNRARTEELVPLVRRKLPRLRSTFVPPPDMAQGRRRVRV